MSPASALAAKPAAQQESAVAIASVSDTARWVAIYRAAESARPDALFDDPYAARLAGARGAAIAARAPRQMLGGWQVVARTVAIDDLVRTAVAEGCDRVLCLAAGLDMRPYRLALPASLTWIEADLPVVIEEKERRPRRRSDDLPAGSAIGRPRRPGGSRRLPRSRPRRRNPGADHHRGAADLSRRRGRRSPGA